VTDILLKRALTPVGKAFVSHCAVQMALFTMEAMGGAGYMEDSNIPEFLRGSIVNIIWEGTSNVHVQTLYSPSALPYGQRNNMVMLPPLVLGTTSTVANWSIREEPKCDEKWTV
jgi:hypothetical protein